MAKVKMSANILFSGIGCQEYGFQKKGLIELDVVNTSEINKDSIITYAAIHHGFKLDMLDSYGNYPSIEEMLQELKDKNIGYNPDKAKPYNWDKFKKRKPDMIKLYWLACYLNKNLGDISRIESLSYADLWTVSFPCQSISCAGKMKGFKPDSGTRSSLLWENIRLLKRAVDDGIPPKFLIFENVKTLVSKKFKNDFLSLLDVISDLGYNTYWEVLNAKFCGIPQNRERVFVVCVRKDIDDNRNEDFEFPKPFMCESRYSDFLDEDVSPKYYLTKKSMESTLKKCIRDDLSQEYEVDDGVLTFTVEED